LYASAYLLEGRTSAIDHNRTSGEETASESKIRRLVASAPVEQFASVPTWCQFEGSARRYFPLPGRGGVQEYRR
jgi:hypothetical protein